MVRESPSLYGHVTVTLLSVQRSQRLDRNHDQDSHDPGVRAPQNQERRRGELLLVLSERCAFYFVRVWFCRLAFCGHEMTSFPSAVFFSFASRMSPALISPWSSDARESWMSGISCASAPDVSEKNGARNGSDAA